jgi:hypothetical protein
VLTCFSDAQRRLRMKDAEIHHDRAPLVGVVRELDAEPIVGSCFAPLDRRRSARLRQAIGVLVRMIIPPVAGTKSPARPADEWS